MHNNINRITETSFWAKRIIGVVISFALLELVYVTVLDSQQYSVPKIRAAMS